MSIILKSQKKNQSRAFTLIELLVVIAILGILAVVGLASFRSSQAKARDARRKSDLANIQRAFEMYFNDYGSYPLSDASGQVVIPNVGSLAWAGGTEFIDENGTIYMKQLPNDPSGNRTYCYLSDGTSYRLYARLENTEDFQRLTNPVTCNSLSYNYGISSSDVNP